MRSITLRHNFETAHRLPMLGNKCTNVHGHSWWAEVTVAAPDLDAYDTVVEFGTFKAAMRAWIDTWLDHATMLGKQDPLTEVLIQHGCKVYVFGRDYDGADWPTVEAVTALIAAKAPDWLPPDLPNGARVERVRVSETHVNAAEWNAPTRRVTVAEVWDRATQSLRESA